MIGTVYIRKDNALQTNQTWSPNVHPLRQQSHPPQHQQTTTTSTTYQLRDLPTRLAKCSPPTEPPLYKRTSFKKSRNITFNSNNPYDMTSPSPPGVPRSFRLKNAASDPLYILCPKNMLATLDADTAVICSKNALPYLLP